MTGAEIGHQGFGKALSFIVAGARANGVYVAVVSRLADAPRDRRRSRTSRHGKHARRAASPPAGSCRSVAADQRRCHGIGLVVRWRCGAGQIVDVVETRQLVFERPHDVVFNDLEPPAGCQRANVCWPPSVKIVDADHMVALTHQVFAEMRAEKARAACHYNAKLFSRDHTC